ncbi:MAG: hypothetical protein AAF637_17640 [Pseudomonadota bacterium]
MTSTPFRILPILALGWALGACVPPAGYENPDIRADYVIQDHLFDVRAVENANGYDVYVAELGGPYLTDFALLDTDAHARAAELVLRDRCDNPALDGNWYTFGVVPAPQPSLGVVASFTCS